MTVAPFSKEISGLGDYEQHPLIVNHQSLQGEIHLFAEDALHKSFIFEFYNLQPGFFNAAKIRGRC